MWELSREGKREKKMKNPPKKRGIPVVKKTELVGQGICNRVVHKIGERDGIQLVFKNFGCSLPYFSSSATGRSITDTLIGDTICEADASFHYADNFTDCDLVGCFVEDMPTCRTAYRYDETGLFQRANDLLDELNGYSGRFRKNRCPQGRVAFIKSQIQEKPGCVSGSCG